MKEMKAVVHDYLRPSQPLPHIWCPGCTHGTVMNSAINAIDSLGYSKDEVILVSGIGCSSRAPNYYDFNALHTTHGKAIAFATGVSLAHPDKKVIVFTGDGDGTAIGGNHLIHASRRNIDLTVILFNNNIYGMTGGQYSPTTPDGSYAATAPYSMVEPQFDICKLVEGAGAPYVARGSAVKPRILTKYIADAIKKPGFAFVEAMSYCPPVYGFYNGDMKPVNHYHKMKERIIDIKKVEMLKSKGEEIPEDKIVTGVFKNEEKETLYQRYEKVCLNAKKTPVSMYLNTLDIEYPVDEE